jgi:hypothetical protein
MQTGLLLSQINLHTAVQFVICRPFLNCNYELIDDDRLIPFLPIPVKRRQVTFIVQKQSFFFLKVETLRLCAMALAR